MVIVRAVLVDDEPMALAKLKLLLEREVGGVKVVATYTNMSEAIAGVMRHRPEVVFLDTRFAAMNGLRFGKQLQTSAPDTEIVFVADDNRYALEAFELYTLDYMIKPVKTDRLRRTIDKLRNRLDKSAGSNHDDSDDAPVVCCFRHLRFKASGAQPWEVKWRTSKVQELFAYLLHHRNRAVDRSILLELLWPDRGPERALQQLYTSVYHIRNTLKSCGMDTIAIRSASLEPGYRLDIGRAKVDAEEWERTLSRLDTLSEQTLAAYERVLSLYEGDYLGGYDYLWAEHERERYRLLWLGHVRKVSEFYTGRGMLKEAIHWHRRVQQLLPEKEDSYAALIRLYRLLGDSVREEEQRALLRSKIDSDP